MTIDKVSNIVRWLGGVLAYLSIGVMLYGLWRGTQRQSGRTTGKMGRFMHSPWFYLLSTAVYLGICYLGWNPVPIKIASSTRFWLLVLGALFYFPGMGLALWGRLALGRNYFVSTGFGAEVFKEHQLVTRGPYALVRHPMYAGLIPAAVGSLLIYATWTTLAFVCFVPLLTIRAHREETVLAAEFGPEWQAYCRAVPRFFPRLRKS